MPWPSVTTPGESFQRATNRPDFAFVTATYNSPDEGYDFAGAYKHTHRNIGADAQLEVDHPITHKNASLGLIKTHC